MVVPWPIIAYDRAVVKNCLWPCQGHVLRDSNHSIYYCMICTGYSLLALSFMLEPFIQFGEYIVMKCRAKPQIDMWFSWCFALALDVWKTHACEINKINGNENAPNVGTKMIDRKEKCQPCLWNAIISPSKTAVLVI